MSPVLDARIFSGPYPLEKSSLLATGKQYASIVLGQDMTTGFVWPAGDSLGFSISESLALLVREPASICVLREKA